MKCDRCEVRPASIILRLNYNGDERQLSLCPTCYREFYAEVLQGAGGPSLPGGIPFGGTSQSGNQAGGMNGHNSFFFNGGPLNQGSWNQGPWNGSPASGQNRIKQHVQDGQQPGLLEQLGRNLTDAARSGKIDPVIGRDKEVERIIEILNRRNKNNPVLIGEPGVGKTAVVEGLALRISEGKVPAKLRNQQIFVLDVASLVADTGIRGQFEERMQQLIAELQARDDVILFIDEMHLLVGAGSAQGSMDAGNILKPALARGDIQVIGATTLKEYRQIEKDAALERRFQPVMVEEPSVEDTIAILEGLVSRYEDFHQVKYTPEAIRAAAELSHRYLRDRRLPDKAIDLMDEAGSKANLRQSADDANTETRLAEIAAAKAEAAKAEDYERAAKLRDEEQALLALVQDTKKQREGATGPDSANRTGSSQGQGSSKVQGSSNQPGSGDAKVVSVEDIRRILEDKTGIPVTKLQAGDQQRLKDLEGHLTGRVIGQANAVRQVAKAIRRSRAGLKPKHRPIGSFLFVGPTGVGKTELARALTNELFGTDEAMIRLDMSEYMERHSVSKIIGSPPGYVGHDEAGQLTEQVRRHPYSLILLDEIEKAHPDVLNLLLQILEDGRLTDSQGRTVHFEDSVIIMTSNAGVSEKKRASLGFRADQDAVIDSDIMGELSSHFKPEFLNRLDAIIRFNALDNEDLEQIVRLMLNELAEQLSANGISAAFDNDVVQWVAVHGRDARFGARPLRRVIQQAIEDPVADFLLDHANSSPTSLRVFLRDDAPVVEQV
ncbi:ATP-dependent Clp protease ATP-binding subunit [Alicyclobacillus ferrooxydans]|uniref:Clp protease ClpX n=1 Tax=Alicyclobacillus ferrooxydans TaxID=471514 RepID=A0A0N8PP96_9BACL|nr:ATP-dependent Clp protease ATP-binding subunit [Alicyclobacillus ferrooxydans]KPV43709.1 Clp protease ClpX [Alicyclobacillus ferrooxydans]